MTRIFIMNHFFSILRGSWEKVIPLNKTRERSYSVSDAGAYDFRGMSPSNAYWDRICPGKEFADSTLFITIAMAVAVFNISKAKDDRGTDIEPRREYVPGTIRCVPITLLLLVLPSGLSG